MRGSDSKCISCTNPKPVFDLYQKDCVACPDGTKLNPETHKCEKAETPAVTSKCTSNYIWSDSQNKCICPETFPIDLECECPKSAPNELNGECIACNAPFEWKSATNTCELKVNYCPAATPIVPTIPTVQTCTSNFVWDDSVKQCVCPPNLPFNDGTKCLQCNLPQYWDHDTKKCSNCLANQYFNTISRACEPCPAAKPLWRNNACEACPDGTTYDQASNSCQLEDSFIDPSTTAKVPVFTTVPIDNSFIDPSVTAKVPVYSTSPTH